MYIEIDILDGLETCDMCDEDEAELGVPAIEKNFCRSCARKLAMVIRQELAGL